MKRFAFVFLVLFSLLFAGISCNAETPAAGDRLVHVFVEGESRTVNASMDSSSVVEDLYWYYTAVKADSWFYITGTKESPVPVKGSSATPEKGLKGADLGLFSQGSWSFSFWGFYSPEESSDMDNAVYFQEGNLVEIDAQPSTNISVVLARGTDVRNAGLIFRDLSYLNADKAGSSVALDVFELGSDVSVPIVSTDPVTLDSSGECNFTMPSVSEVPTFSAGVHSLMFVVYEVSGESKGPVIGYYTMEVYSTPGTMISLSGEITPFSAEGTGTIVISDSVELVLPVPDTTEVPLAQCSAEISVSSFLKPETDLWNDSGSASGSVTVPSGVYHVHIGLSDGNGTFGSLARIVTVSADENVVIDGNVAGTAYASWTDAFGIDKQSERGYAKGMEEFTGETTYTYKYLVKKNGDGSLATISSRSDLTGADIVDGKTVTEDNTLRYWFHKPFNYDSTKVYPLVVYIPGTGANLYNQADEITEDATCSPSTFNCSDYSQWMHLLAGINDGNNSSLVYSSVKADSDEFAVKDIFGDGGDYCFIKAWFDHVKSHPEDDCFFIILDMNDELWWENRAFYHIDADTDGKYVIDYTKSSVGTDKNAILLDIRDAYLAGGDGRGSYKYAYGQTYLAQDMGPNVWFQLLVQLQDQIIRDYSCSDQYVVGFSLGGVAVYDLISNYPDRYKGAVACSAPGADISNANTERIKTDVLGLYGEDDSWVSYKVSESFIASLDDNRTGSEKPNAEYYSLPSYGHDARILSVKFNYIFNNYLYGSDTVSW